MPEWERFIRRLHDQGYKFIVTGSNASLLSQELGTRLTGRSIRVELYPFSFREYLDFRKIKAPDLSVLTTRQKGNLRKLADDYIAFGGIPDALKYPELEFTRHCTTMFCIVTLLPDISWITQEFERVGFLLG